MKINGYGNVKFSDGGGTPTTAEEQIAVAQDLKEDLLAAREELISGQDYYEFLSLEEQARIQAVLAEIDGVLANLDYLIETGEWPGVGGAFTDDMYAKLPDLDRGWSASETEIIYADHSGNIFEYYDLKTKAEGLNLAEVIEVPGGGSDVGAAIAFAIKDDDHIEKVTGKTVGEDIWITVEYDNAESKTFILKGLAVRPDIQIYISAYGCKKDVVFDFHKVIRVFQDPTTGKLTKAEGMVGGLKLIGGEGDDIIVGSQNYDLIEGGIGADRLYGMGGDDEIYGDTIYQDENGILNAVNDSTGGADYIDGGDGGDTIFGGGGMDTAVRDPFEPITDTVGTDVENSTGVEFKDSAGDLDGFLIDNIKNPGWSAKVDEATGEVVLTKNIDPTSETGNSIEIQAPAGYTLAYAESEDDSEDIVITFVKMAYDDDDNPSPSYLRVRILNAKAEGNETHITVITPEGEDSIFDFSKCYAGGNSFSLLSHDGNDTNDVLIAPRTYLDDIRIDASQLNPENGGTLSATELKGIIDGNYGTDKKWVDIELDGEMTNTGTDYIELTPKERNVATINFEPPVGFKSVDGVFYEIDADGNMIVYVIHITNEKTGAFDLLKIKINDVAGDGTAPAVQVAGKEAEPLATVELDAGAGEDLVVGSISSTINWGDNDPDDNDRVIKGWHTDVGENSGGTGYTGLTGPATWNNQPLNDSEGNQLNWDDKAPFDGSKTVWDMVTIEGKDPTTGEALTTTTT